MKEPTAMYLRNTLDGIRHLIKRNITDLNNEIIRSFKRIRDCGCLDGNCMNCVAVNEYLCEISTRIYYLNNVYQKAEQEVGMIITNLNDESYMDYKKGKKDK